MPASDYRFSAAQLFYVISLSAASTALFGLWGLAIAAFVALVWWQILCGVRRETQQLQLQPAPVRVEEACDTNSSRSAMLKVELAISLVVSVILLGLLIPTPRDSDPMRHAATSMQMIAKARSAYKQQHGEYPPDVVYDDAGHPMHSWRALILEHLGEEKLASAYRIDEPWDSLHNSRLAEYRPWHYQTFYEDDSDSRIETSVHSLDLGTTVFVVEHEQARVNWLQPTQLTSDRWTKLNRVPQLNQGFWHCGFFVSHYRGRLVVTDNSVLQLQPGALLADRATSVLSTSVAPVSNSNMRIVGNIDARYHFGNAFRLAFFLLVALYPIRWLKKM